jgi:hypothetical protein
MSYEEEDTDNPMSIRNPRNCLNCGMCQDCIDRSILAANEMRDKHWSELSGEWYYVGTVAEQYDFITHDVEAEELDDELSGMFLLWKDGRSEFAPKTRLAWDLLAKLDDCLSEDPEPVCVGKVVDGWCVPIGTDGNGEDFDYGDSDLQEEYDADDH